MLSRLREAGYPAALAAQNGLEHLPVPWNEFDVLFLGGDTDWKIGQHARRLTAEAKARGKSVHMGRVNSRRRLQIAAHMGCDSADGTYLAHAPDQNLPRLLDWLKELSDQLALFDPTDVTQHPPRKTEVPSHPTSSRASRAATQTSHLPRWPTPPVPASPTRPRHQR
jgi:EAL domain-containing protein (putative c-di-GMP-specific phosphodiesterase class I)